MDWEGKTLEDRHQRRKEEQEMELGIKWLKVVFKNKIVLCIPWNFLAGSLCKQ